MNQQDALSSQLREIVRLVIAAIEGITHVVEEMHLTIGSGPALLGRPFAGFLKPAIAPSYALVRATTSLVGTAIDQALKGLSPLLAAEGIDRGFVLAALNGVLGDYLVSGGSSLALNMQIYADGQRIDLDSNALAQRFPVGDRLLLLIHGSCLDESAWQRQGMDYGSVLREAFGLTPLYLRYNTGRHISENGQLLADLLEQLLLSWPRPGVEINILGHSMGGLLARSACHSAEKRGLSWIRHLSRLVMLGSPHQGSPLERAGNWIDQLLGAHPYSSPLAQLGKIRSAGVTDLRFGNVIEEQWMGKDRFAHDPTPRISVPLPEGVACYAVAASRSRPAKGERGDGLVPVDSALGIHSDPNLDLHIPEDHRLVVHEANHLDLLAHPLIVAKLKEWMRPAD